MRAARSPQALRRLERRLLSHYARSEQWAALDSLVRALPQPNPAAFERLSLALLHAYRAAGQPADVQRVRAALLHWRGGNPDLQQRVAYFDVTGRLGQLAPGQRPAPADSTTLVTVAGSGTSFAPVACSTLRYYYPQLQCGVTPLLPKAARAQTLAATRPQQLQALHLRALPNPANETVRLEVSEPAPADSHLELLELATGRVVLTTTMPLHERALQLDVRTLPPGVYAARLLTGSQLKATTKLVIVR